MPPDARTDYLTESLRGKTVAEVHSHNSAGLEVRFTDGTRLSVKRAETGIELSVTSETNRSLPSGLYSGKQGQYLAFISNYSKLNGRPPAEAEIQRFFKVTPPSVHQMILTLEKR